MNLNYLRTFAKVAELRSFTKAAKILRQPKSRVSRSIAQLEKELGIELVRRTTRHTSLTSLGEEFYQRVHLLIRQIEEEVDFISEAKQEMSGVLRITAPEDLGQTLLVQLLTVYAQKYPQVEIQTVITSEFLDLAKENIDLAFRAGKLTDTSYLQRKLVDVRFIMVASKTYLQTYSKPVVLPDLLRHRLLFFRDVSVKNLTNRKEDAVAYKPYLRSDSLPMLLTMVLGGNGISILPDFLCKRFLDSGTLIRVLPRLQSEVSGIHIVYPSSQNMAKRTSELIELALSLFSRREVP